MVKPKPKSKSNDKNGEKSMKSRKFSLMRSIRSLSGRKKAKKNVENQKNNKENQVVNQKIPEPMSNSVYFDLKKNEKDKSKKRQSRMGGVEPSQQPSSDDKTVKTVNPTSSQPPNEKKIPEYENIKTAKSLMLLQARQNMMESSSNRSKKKNEKNLEALAKRKKKRGGGSQNMGSVFDDVAGPLSPVNAEPRGAEDKMKWKIDVEGVDINGDQRMTEVLEKLGKLRKKYKIKKCKVLKANEVVKDGDDEPTEDEISMGAKVLQMVRMDQLIHEKLDSEEKGILKKYCRSGDQEEAAEELIEKITMTVLIGVSSKNNFIRNVSIPGQMRMWAVDENKSKLPVMALLLVRCDLLYYAWLKPSSNEEELDPTWRNMTIRKVPTPAVVSAYYPAARGQGPLQKK